MMLINHEIEAIIKNLKKDMIKNIYVFGSYATGHQTKDSDIDLCIIVDHSNIPKRDLLRTFRKSIMNVVNKPIDIIIYSNEEFEARSQIKTTLEYKIMTEGVKVYEQ